MNAKLLLMIKCMMFLSFLSSCSVLGADGKDIILEDFELSKCANKDIPKIQLKQDSCLGFVIESVSWWMPQIQGKISNQGADCYGNYLCQFRADHSSLDILDMKEKQPVATIELEPLGNSYHCNNADFSSSFFDETDYFPLIYSSHQGKDARCILVERIYFDKNIINLETVQRIDLPCEMDIPLQFTPDAILDTDNRCLYVYTGNTVPITDFYIYKFRLPDFTEGNIRLSEKDLLSSWSICDCPSYYKQGGMIRDSILYIMEGVPGWSTDNILRVINLKTGTFQLINLTEMFDINWEPEDIFVYDNHFYIASNRSGIFRIDFVEH